jgi:hypothetical protein
LALLSQIDSVIILYDDLLIEGVDVVDGLGGQIATLLFLDSQNPAPIVYFVALVGRIFILIKLSGPNLTIHHYLQHL